MERGWCPGGEEFRQELLEQVEARPGPSHFGEAVQEAKAAQAERQVVEGLKQFETLGGCFAGLSDMLELDALQIEAARNLCQSRMGIYEVLGACGAGLRLRELVTDRNFEAVIASGFKGRAGDLILIGLLPRVPECGLPWVGNDHAIRPRWTPGSGLA